MQKEDPWRELSFFGSNDYVRRWYKERHKRTLSAERAFEIVCCINQGKEYFASASSAGTAVKPLLLYYGVLSLSRGIILLLNSKLSESSLTPGHGLEVLNWQQTLSSGISNAFDLEVRGTRGTFRELAEATKNQDIGHYFMCPNPRHALYHHNYPSPRFLEDGGAIRLDDILSRDSALLDIYAQSANKRGRIYMGTIEEFQGETTLHFIEVNHATQNPDAMIVGRKISEIEFSERSQTIQIPGRSLKINMPVQQIRDILPIVEQSHNFLYLIEDFPNGDRFSKLLRMFILAYFLGMLVRYFPSRWIALTQNQKGDAIQPLLLASIDNLHMQFPRQVRQALA